MAGTQTGMTDTAGTVGHDTSGPTTDDAMTLSEERLNVGTRREEVGRARLRKYVVTENVTQTVPVEREEVRIEREPITDANIGNAMDGPAISEEEHEVVLHAERPVVEKEAVPVERVRLDKQIVSEQEKVSDTVRKEAVEIDGIEDADRRAHLKRRCTAEAAADRERPGRPPSVSSPGRPSARRPSAARRAPRPAPGRSAWPASGHRRRRSRCPSRVAVSGPIVLAAGQVARG